MSTVAILGAGDIAGATARALAAGDRQSRILIVDAAAAVAQGKALDIQQTGAVDRFHTRLEGTEDLSRLTGCRICIVADRFGRESREWQGEDGLALMNRISGYLGDAPLVFAGSSQSDLIAAAAREARIERTRLIGSATEAFASAVRAIVAAEARCSPGEVMLTVLGVPPDGFVIAWSEASIGGYALHHVLNQVQTLRIEARAARLWPPGPYALGAAAARVAAAMLDSSRAACAVLTVLNGEFGVRNGVGAMPVLLSRRGIAHMRTPSLTPRERVRLETALGA